MKKSIVLFVAFLMAFSIITATFPLYVFAKEADLASEASVPDDAFEGDYAEFKGKDGSITRVFDNGSVSTKNADGSVTAVDYTGNHHYEDKDGNYTVRATDGYVATEYADGRRSLTEPNGKTITINTDGSFSESFGIGITKDYDANGKCVGIGFNGSKERIGTDENGCYLNGELTGSDGQKLVITDDSIQFVNSKGTQFDYGYKYEETADATSVEKETIHIQYTDDTTVDSAMIDTWNNGAHTADGTMTFAFSDGTRWDEHANITYSDDSAEVVKEHTLTASNGSTFWFDEHSGQYEYHGANGDTIIADENGQITTFHTSEIKMDVSYDKNGDISTANYIYPDGTRIVRNDDGSATVTLPDGTIYESDGKGNVTKNGEPIKKDGKVLKNGKELKEEEPQEIAETGYEEENNEETAEGTSFIEKICGTYIMSGNDHIISERATFSDNGGKDHSVECTVTVTDANDGTINIQVDDGITVNATVNAETKTATASVVPPIAAANNLDLTYYYVMTFDVSGKTVSADLNIKITGLSEMNVSGQKS